MKVNVNISFECSPSELKMLLSSDMEEAILAIIGDEMAKEKMTVKQPKKVAIKKQAPKKQAVKRQAPKKQAVKRTSK